MMLSSYGAFTFDRRLRVWSGLLVLEFTRLLEFSHGLIFYTLRSGVVRSLFTQPKDWLTP